MDNKFNTAEMIEKIRKSNFVHYCGMPMGYTAGYPLLSIRNERLCLIIPFLKYKVTGVVDKTLVYPIRYIITISINNGSVAGFEDLSYRRAFTEVDFNKPVGYFRHDSIKNMNKKEYMEKKNELLSMYDKMAAAVMGNGEFTEEDDLAFYELLNKMLEPSLKEEYKFLDADFYGKYLSDEEE